jgi:hypothetical protein
MRFILVVAFLLLVPTVVSAQVREYEPAMRVASGASWSAPPAPRIVHTVTPAMRVWVLRGSGPAGARVLGPLAIEARSDDADEAIDRLQERALAMHADAIVRVHIEHRGDHTVSVEGVAVRFG